MRFKEWLLNEEIWVSFPRSMLINGIVTDAIDFRFEDWGRGYNPDKQRDYIPMKPPHSPNRFIFDSFSAPLKNGTYLNIKLGGVPKSIGNLNLSLKPDKQIYIGHEPTENLLPRHWYDFAMFLRGNDIVKMPEWPRQKSEEGEAEVEPSDISN